MSRNEMAVALAEMIQKAQANVPAVRRGAKGERGDQGMVGPKGERGPQGPPGERPAEFDEVKKLFDSLEVELRQLSSKLENANRKTQEVRKELPNSKGKSE